MTRNAGNANAINKDMQNPKAAIEFCKSCAGASQQTDALLREYIESLGIIGDDNIQKKLLKELVKKYVALEKRVDGLLKNTLPDVVAEEIKFKSTYAPRSCECTILFTDFVGFTGLAEKVPAEQLIVILDDIFKQFDDTVNSFRGTKIKTIGDAYMAVFGSPREYEGHAAMAIRAALAFLKSLEGFNRKTGSHFQMRVGIHTGRVTAGVVGKERMQFDVFGDNVNIASRFESSGVPGRVNVSEATYRRAQESFFFEERGEIGLKNKANMKAYLVAREL